jgi:hypothetical protein
MPPARASYICAREIRAPRGAGDVARLPSQVATHMSPASLAVLKDYFGKSATLKTMNKKMNRCTKCAMNLSNRGQTEGYEAWFLLHWNAMTDVERDDFRAFVGRMLILEPPSMFCVDVRGPGPREPSPRVVVFYIRQYLQPLAEVFYPRARPQDSLQDAISALHYPQAADRDFVSRVYDLLPLV